MSDESYFRLSPDGKTLGFMQPFTPDLYAAGVDYVGVSNLLTFLRTIPPYWKPFLDMMQEMVGHPEKDKALRRRGVEVEYMVKENEGHGFRNEENQFEFYEAMERFLAKHLKG